MSKEVDLPIRRQEDTVDLIVTGMTKFGSCRCCTNHNDFDKSIQCSTHTQSTFVCVFKWQLHVCRQYVMQKDQAHLHICAVSVFLSKILARLFLDALVFKTHNLLHKLLISLPTSNFSSYPRPVTSKRTVCLCFNVCQNLVKRHHIVWPCRTPNQVALQGTQPVGRVKAPNH